MTLNGRLFCRLTLVTALVAQSGASQLRAQQPDEHLAAFESLVGLWGPPAEVTERIPRLANRVIHDYRWSVGGNALQLREGYPVGSPGEAELAGMIYWNPALEIIEFVAVAGHGPGQGRVFRGEYRVLEDGSIERTYQVFYRTLADIPGEELGGMARRYREIYTPVTSDSTRATLEWWQEGAWRPFGPGVYHLIRVRPGS